MSKNKTKGPAEPQKPVNPAPETTAPASVPKPTKVAVAKTPAQIAAEEALAKANQEAQEVLRKQAEPLLKPAEDRVNAALKELGEARIELVKVQQAAGIEPTKLAKGTGTRVPKVTVNRLTYVAPLKEGLGGQQAQILELIKAAGDTGIDREKLVKQMKEVIVTKMDHSRLLSFYQKPLIENGNVTAN